MNDPHVVSLRYKFVSEDPSDIFDKAEPLKTSFGPFEIELRDNTLVAKPHDHYPDPDSAKAALEPYLRSWESNAFLHPGRYRIRFTYVTAEVIDRNLPASRGATYHLRASAGAITITGNSATLSRRMAKFPAPDPSFQASDLTDLLISRFKQYRDGREPLPGMAYWILRNLEDNYGHGSGSQKRDTTAKRMGVDPKVLNKMGELTGQIDDPEIGRKPGGTQQRKYSTDELTWLEAVVARLIRRVGELNAGGTNLQQITLGDLPPV